MKTQTIISLSLNREQQAALNAAYLKATGSSNQWDNIELYRKMYSEACQKWYVDCSVQEAQVVAEPIRIANPGQCVSVYNLKGDWIGNTSWDDQMKMFFGYPVYTPEGEKLKEERLKEAALLQLQPSWD